MNTNDNNIRDDITIVIHPKDIELTSMINALIKPGRRPFYCYQPHTHCLESDDRVPRWCYVLRDLKDGYNDTETVIPIFDGLGEEITTYVHT